MKETMTMTLKLSITERIILANQLRILEAVGPDEPKDYARQREALECGYELEYKNLARPFSEPGLTEAECNEVYEILQMHRALHHAQRELAEAGIDAAAVRFQGFDGNHETMLMAYCRFICSESKYAELGDPNGFNSLRPMLDRYRRMLRVYTAINNEQRTNVVPVERNLTADEIRQILDAEAPGRKQ